MAGQRLQGKQLDSPAILVWGNGTLAPTTTPRFLAPGYDSTLAQTASLGFRVPKLCNVRNLRVRARLAGSGAQILTFAFNINGVASALVASGLASLTDWSDLVNVVTCLAGDLVGIEVTRSAAGGGSPTDILASVEVF